MDNDGIPSVVQHDTAYIRLFAHRHVFYSRLILIGTFRTRRNAGLLAN